MQNAEIYQTSLALNLADQVSIVENIPRFTGNYSTVFLGNLNNNLVAVKVVKASGQPDTVIRRLNREIAVWSSAIHPNIYPFYGFANGAGFGPFGALISPWCPNGDASRFLDENGQRMILAERISLWKGVVEGVIYLHDYDPPIVHGDLKPGNVLIDETGVPRICDFGLARIFSDQAGTGLTTTSEHTGTPRYLAPELVISETSVPPTLASDVYALGCLGLVFLYLQQPYHSCVNNLRGQIFQDIRRGIPPATAPPRRNWSSGRLWPAITMCWNADPGSRLSAFMLGHRLKLTIFTLPPSIIQRIIQLLDSSFYDGERWIDFDHPKFKLRTSCLVNLSLVSRACHAWANPALYRYVGLYARGMFDSLGRINSLNSTLQASLTKALTLNLATDGYGTNTEIFVLFFPWNTHSPLDPSNAIKTLVYRMPRLKLAVLGPASTGDWPARIDSITTLEIRNFSISFLLDHSKIMQALSCFQRLCLVFCTRRLLPVVRASKSHFPNLQEVDIDFNDNIAASEFLEDLSTWTAPILRSLCYYLDQDPSPLLKFLSSHGPVLRYITLKFRGDNKGAVISQILLLCPNLASAVILDAPLDTLIYLRYHPILERLHIDRAQRPLVDGYINHFKEVVAVSLFPNLKLLVVH